MNAIPPSKPPTAVLTPETREPHSIRFSPTEWRAIEEAALARAIEPSRFARSLCLTGLRMLDAHATLEAHTRRTG